MRAFPSLSNIFSYLNFKVGKYYFCNLNKMYFFKNIQEIYMGRKTQGSAWLPCPSRMRK